MSLGDLEFDLVQQAGGGDREALSQLLLIHYDELYRHIGKEISTDLQGLIRADDILQQTFVRAALSVGSFEWRHPNSLRGWLKTIAGNLVKDAERRRRRERRARQPDRLVSAQASSDWAACELLPADATSPSGRIQRKESIRRLRLAVASLPEVQQEAIEYCYLRGLPLADAARAMGRTKGAVRGICYRARQNLKTILGGSSLYFSG